LAGQRLGSSANATVTVPVDFSVNVEAGDKLAFLVNMNGNIGFDTTAFDPTIKYDGGETHTPRRSSVTAGRNGWRYQYIEEAIRRSRLLRGPKQWRKQKTTSRARRLSGRRPASDVNQDAARVWTAPKAGRVRVTATVCNTGNKPASSGGYGREWERKATLLGTPYWPKTRTTRRRWVGLFRPLASSFQRHANGAVTIQLKVAGHKQSCPQASR